MPNLKGGILYSRCPCNETRHLARQVGGASAGFVFFFINLKFIVKFIVKFCVKLSVRVEICSKALSAFGAALVSDLAKRGTESDVQDDKEEKGNGSLGVPAVPWPRLRS